MNLAEALAKEIERNRELLRLYQELPPNVGTFGAMMIDIDIKAGMARAIHNKEATRHLWLARTVGDTFVVIR